MRHRNTTRARGLRRAQTDAERCLWQRLRAGRLAGYKFRRQHPIGESIADLVCLEASLVVEIDGGQHQDNRTHDQARSRRLEALGYRVLRFWNDEVLLQTDQVLAVILRALQDRTR